MRTVKQASCTTCLIFSVSQRRTCDAVTIASFTYELQRISRVSDQDRVQMYLFTHAAHNRRPSMSDVFTHVGNTLYGLGKKQRLGRWLWPSFSIMMMSWYTYYQCLDISTTQTKEGSVIYMQAEKSMKPLHSVHEDLTVKKKAAAFWICVQQQHEQAIWQHERLSGEIF